MSDLVNESTDTNNNITIITTTTAATIDRTSNSNSSNEAYINKYLPVIWSELKNVNADKYLLTLKKLQTPVQQFDASLKICILKYLNAIEPIAYVNASQLSNNSCGYMVIREHVSVLHMVSTRSFRCLKSYKISISNTYVNATQVK